ncbi:hypothetical protein GCM10029976_078580 [Kribbella albertanoniae]|uniref:DUF3137 domain-containing protein n=1 Tax=Kribbella albertanoniae TaxID=1266829 RepID=A0A4R4P200_9ACTN|nr:DUF3137 domain-containing protein [Kribbella albertanoniae]TDC15604.1 hypothetical protein E1261_40260 [Kribbella albertanoniae]
MDDPNSPRPGGLMAAIVLVRDKIIAQLNLHPDQRQVQMTLRGLHKVPPNEWLCHVAAQLYEPGEPREMWAFQFPNRMTACVLEYVLPGRQQRNGRAAGPPVVHLVSVTLPLTLPPLTVTTDSRLKQFIKGNDLHLGHEAFDDAFHVRASDEQYARSLLHPSVLDWVLRFRDMQWQVAGNSLVAWGEGEFVPLKVTQLVRALVGIADRLPPSVLRDYGRSTTLPPDEDPRGLVPGFD